MNPKLFQALGGGLPTQASQQPAPAPAGSPAPGAGLSLFQGLAPQQQQMGAQPLQMGPMVADGGIPTQDKEGSKSYQDMSIIDRMKAAAAGIDPYTGKPKK